MNQKTPINFTIPLIGIAIIIFLSLSSFTVPKDGAKRYKQGVRQEYDATHRIWISTFYDYKK
jgi:hypothetical protein